MADNVNLASPSGTARADEVGGFLYQGIKIAFGPDNTATDVTTTDRFPVATDPKGFTSTSGTITRPSNANTYAALDVVGATAAALSFANIGPSGADIVITGVELRIDLAAVPSGMTSFRLHLYSVTPPSALADEAAFDIPSGDRAAYLGFIDMGTPVDYGATLYAQINGVNKHVKLAGTGLFGYLQTIGSYVAASGGTHAVTLHAAV